MASEDHSAKTLHDELSLPIILADRVVKSAREAESSKHECADLARLADRLSHALRSATRLAVYDRPLRRISADLTRNLDRALTLTRKCRSGGVLRQVFAIASAADFRKVAALLESSAADLRWLLAVFDGEASLSLPPIASNDPIVAWVWSSIATVQMGRIEPRIDAANEIASLARDSERNRKIIVDEVGVPPLLKLLKEVSSPEAQVAAANAILSVATDEERVRAVVEAQGIPIIVQVLTDSPIKVQAATAKLVSAMAELDSGARDEFARENVTRPLISLLAIDTLLDDSNVQPGKKTTILSIVQINKELAAKSSNASLSSSPQGQNRKDREAESSDTKLKLKTVCAEALCKLCRDSLMHSRKVTETKGMICLAKIIETGEGDLRRNCLMTVMEIAAVAEISSDLRRAAFKTNSPAAKAVLDQLLRVIQEESSPELQIPAIKSIGCLARTFPARETRIINPLVSRLGDRNANVANEAAISLGKFVSPENFNCVEHSKAIVEFDGVPPLMRLLKVEGPAQVHGTKLMAYLALHVGNSKALEQARALTALETAARFVLTHNPELRELFSKAIHHLVLYQAGAQ